MSLKSLLAITITGLLITGCGLNNDWKTARRDSAGIAPDPSRTHEAIVQVYGADAWGWRGWFAIHTWIAAKRSGEDFYTVYDVVGWRSSRNEPVMRVARDIPDRYWYGEKPKVLKDIQGAEADQLINAIDQAARDYPWKTTYKVFPGPNSNTFVAWIAKQVPELELELPFSAIGSGYVK
ncbi:DUF3750 domain-containing protein [Desulfopila aestuarii]|uniref:DUF3750 domain-containing protein n=1 Tax=Desulfopila aestuarii DSM 18488 TaxID=1121416 RepID=A0A1M7Y4P1_9BACT|nr:DUF3750 domain-containing protein [Desulfopila aestuarii]SHO47313.1 Protein of unknown function [Desulfopila aestuarii DSM 18488]